jgi:hypothetical protein
MLREKRQAKKEFRRTMRIEIAKLRNKEKENILETRTKDTNTFNFGLALNVVFAEEVRVSVSFRSSLVCEISA